MDNNKKEIKATTEAKNPQDGEIVKVKTRGGEVDGKVTAKKPETSKKETKEELTIKKAYANDERKLKLALLVFNAEGYDSIKEETLAMNFAKMHCWEMRNELNLLLGINLECKNC